MPKYKTSSERRKHMNIPDSKLNGTGIGISSDGARSKLRNETLPAKILLLLTALVLFYTICLPLVLTSSDLATPMCWIICLLCALTFLTTAKKFSAIFFVFILGFFPITYTGQPIVTALLFGAVICLGGGAAAISTGKGLKAALSFLLPLLSYAVSFMITLDPIYSLTSLIPYLPMFAMGISCRIGKDKKTSIIITTAVIVATIVGFTALFIQGVYGELSKETISVACSELSQSYIKMMEEAFIAAGQEPIDPALQMQLQAMVDLLINSIFGLTVSICLVAVYLAFGIQYRLIEVCGIKRFMKPGMVEIPASATAALIFIISHILTYTTNSSGGISISAVVGMNLCYILMPLLALKGYEALKLLIKKYLLLGLIAAAVIVIAIFSLSSLTSSSALILIAFVGALYVVIIAVDQWAKEFYKKGGLNE